MSKSGEVSIAGGLVSGPASISVEGTGVPGPRGAETNTARVSSSERDFRILIFFEFRILQHHLPLLGFRGAESIEVVVHELHYLYRLRKKNS